MHEALDERVGNAFRYLLSVIVIRLMTDIYHWLFDVSHPMSEQIYGYHGKSIFVFVVLLYYIVGIGILRAEILTKPKCLCLYPCLLQFDENKFQCSVILLDFRPEVNAKH